MKNKEISKTTSDQRIEILGSFGMIETAIVRLEALIGNPEYRQQHGTELIANLRHEVEQAEQCLRDHGVL